MSGKALPGWCDQSPTLFVVEDRLLLDVLLGRGWWLPEGASLCHLKVAVCISKLRACMRVRVCGVCVCVLTRKIGGWAWGWFEHPRCVRGHVYVWN